MNDVLIYYFIKYIVNPIHYYLILLSHMKSVITWDKLYSTDKKLNIILNNCLDSGIQKIEKESFGYITIKFNNNVSYRYWDANKYYGWLSSGKFFGDIEYNYREGMPTIPTMYRLKKVIEKF